MRYWRVQPMNTIAANVQLPGKRAAGIMLAIPTEGASPRFDFAQTRKERLLGPAQYLILVRRHYAKRAKLSWTFRGMTN
jgi:hypothetical protein